MNLQQGVPSSVNRFAYLRFSGVEYSATTPARDRALPAGAPQPRSDMAVSPSAPFSFRITVASHLDARWGAKEGFTSFTTGWSSTGLPTTTMVVMVRDQVELIYIIAELHLANLEVLRVDLQQGA